MTAKLTLALVVVSAAACGSAHHTQDAGLMVTPDAFTPVTGDAGVNAVMVHVTAGGVPVGGTGVYFQAADSSLVGALATDEHGIAWAVVPDGGFATVLAPPDGSGVTRLYTFSGVHAGDVLEVAVAPVGPQSSLDLMLTVPPGGADATYAVYTPCGDVHVGGSMTGEVQLAGCGNPTDMLAVDYDADGNPAGALFQTDVAIACPATDAAACTAALTGGYAPLVPTSFAYTAVPSQVAYVKTDQELWSGRGKLFDAATGAAPASPGADVNLTLAQPADTSQHSLTALTVTDAMPTAEQHGEQLVYDWGTYDTQYALALGDALMPAYQSDAVYNSATHSIEWTESSGASVVPDFARAQLHASRDAIPVGGTWTWSIIAPRGASSPAAIALPQLPVGTFDYNPHDGDAISVSDLTNVHLVAPDPYSAARGHGFAAISQLVASVPGGRAVVELPYSPTL